MKAKIKNKLKRDGKVYLPPTSERANIGRSINGVKTEDILLIISIQNGYAKNTIIRLSTLKNIFLLFTLTILILSIQNVQNVRQELWREKLKGFSLTERGAIPARNFQAIKKLEKQSQKTIQN